MIRYEGLLLTVPQITQDETQQLEAAVEKIIEQNKGSVLSFERWGKYKLAYPVKKNEYGIYFLVRFDIPKENSALADFKMLFTVKLHAIVMRNMFSRLDSHQPLAYQRPKSLEEMPSRDVDTFL